MQKRIVTIIAAAVFVLGTGLAAAQSRGGGGMGGGGMHGGGGMGGGATGGTQGGGSWHGGGSNWNGGGGSWNGGGSHGGGSWNGGGWHGGGNWNGGGWHGGGGNWNGGGWHGGGWHGGGWYGGRWYGGTNVGFYFGLPGAWWWPGYYPYWGGGGYYGYAANPNPYYADAAGYVDQGPVVYIQRDQVADGAYAPAPAPTARSLPAGQFSYYCIEPAGYFPQVQQCARGWLKVVPDGAARPTPIPQYSQ